ncbi:hypothetical protein JTE90_019132 [Oedothorax gibbosus]|uniref:Alpha-latrotoxin n=1 Tax=Oedothorax gibbosus TaxID=931172 RepID=A0AAV6TVD0_9ARAC|nr:hypothetical protein JTE90_019132 [Oedothorax gibbosus]
MLEEIIRTSDISKCNKEGECFVHVASGMGQLDVLKYLHSKGADFFRWDENEESGVHWAARQGHADVIEFLFQIGLSINSVNKAGESPLHLASKQGHQKAVQFLCQNCKNINGTNEEDKTALYLASEQGHEKVVRCLIDAAANLNLPDKHGCTALHGAMRRHQNDVAIMLIKAGCHIDAVDDAGEAAIHIACRGGLLPVAQTLCALGCKIEVPNKLGQYPLHLAVRSGHTELVRCLCLSGCNVEVKNKDGIAVEITALAQGYNEMASLLDKLKNVHLREDLISQLVPSTRAVPKVKLKLFGHSGVGKSAFGEAFRCGYFTSWFRRSLESLTPKNKRSDSATRSSIELNTSGSDRNKLNFETCFETYTRGIEVIQANVSGVGEISIWEFSGHEPYHSLYDHFIGNTNCLHLVLFSLADPYDLQLMQVRYWLRFLQERIPVQEPLGFGGTSSAKPCVALVATHASSAVSCASRVLREAQIEFAARFQLHGEVFVLDASEAGSPGLKAVKAYVAKQKEVVTEGVPKSTCFLEYVCGHLPRWRTSPSGVLLEWCEFVSLVRGHVNQLAGKEHLRELVQQLQIMGEVVYIECESSDMVILDPALLCGTILGHLLSQENLERARVTGLYSVDDVQLLFPDVDAQKLLMLLESLHQCTGCREDECGEMEYEFPCFNILETLDDGLWSPTPEHVVYGGVRLRCRDEEHLLESMFTRLQVCLRKSQRDEASPECDLYQWYGGSKYSSGPIEGLVTLEDEGNAYEVKVRGPRDTNSDCFLFLEDLVSIAEDMCAAACPEIVLERHYMSPVQLKTHSANVCTYPPEQVFDSLLKHGLNGKLSSNIGTETVLSVVFFDSHRIVVTDTDENLMHCRKNIDFRKVMRHSATSTSLSLQHEKVFHRDTPKRRKSLPTYTQHSSTSMQVLHDLYSRLASSPAPQPTLDSGGPAVILALSLPASELPMSGLRALCSLLDPPDYMGRDWCMLGILLGLTEKLPHMDPGFRNPVGKQEYCHPMNLEEYPGYSPTARVIKEWASSPGATLGQMLEKLNDLERKDALEAVLRTLPMFKITWIK